MPVVSVPGRGAWGDVELGGLGRLCVLDLPGGSARTLAIWITAPEGGLVRAGGRGGGTDPGLFEFHTNPRRRPTTSLAMTWRSRCQMLTTPGTFALSRALGPTVVLGLVST